VNGSVTLDDLRAAYRRTSSRIYRILEDGYDFSVENLIIEILTRDALIIDVAFLVLVFGQIEKRLNTLAGARMKSERERGALRERSFGRRLMMAPPGQDNAALRQDIVNWSKIRNDAAHGGQLTSGYAIAAIFERAYQLDALLTDQMVRLDSEGSETG
jgi:hypothetical protein